MRLIDADAFKHSIRSSWENVRHLFRDNEKWVEEVIEGLCEDIDEQPTVNPWILCSEWLPDEEEIVLVDDGADIFTAWYSNGKWESTDSMYFPGIPILKWMPILKSCLKEGEV